ncbi:hypothetical protein CSPX01_16218 [Colletotrichum filicis]|nr:hypothetical protein CSPX01_16218 [Colletotrichum filicis]
MHSERHSALRLLYSRHMEDISGSHPRRVRSAAVSQTRRWTVKLLPHIPDKQRPMVYLATLANPFPFKRRLRNTVCKRILTQKPNASAKTSSRDAPHTLHAGQAGGTQSFFALSKRSR